MPLTLTTRTVVSSSTFGLLSTYARPDPLAPSYVDEATAKSSKLTYVNDAGNAIIKVDNTTDDPNPGPYSTFGRNTVLLYSEQTIEIGSLVVMDAVHIPFGVSGLTDLVEEMKRLSVGLSSAACGPRSGRWTGRMAT
jgi:hypothetical protein